MAARQFPNLPDHLLVRLCTLFLDGIQAGEVADTINAELALLQLNEHVTRQQIYALLNEARRRGFFVVRAPRHTTLPQTLADLYRVDKESLVVVNAQGAGSPDHLAQEAAEEAARLITEVGEQKETKRKDDEVRSRKKHTQEEKEARRRVHIGLGAGFTTLNIARHLAHELRALGDHPDLVLHALSPGFQVDRPRTSPLGFFGLFDDFEDHVQYIGLFAATSLDAALYEREIRKYPASVAFKCRNEIDIVITSLASAQDKHGNLNQFLKMQPEQEGALKSAGWIGDLQYRPFSAEGAITDVPSIKTVTLFELDDLRAFAARPDKHVLLVSGPCVDCGETREEPLDALLTVPELKVWNRVVMDVRTAERLAEMARKKPPQMKVTPPRGGRKVRSTRRGQGSPR